MNLKTASELPLISPLTGVSEVEFPEMARLQDLTASLGVLHLRGPEAQATIERFLAPEPDPGTSLAIGLARAAGAGILCRLAAREYLLLAESGEAWNAARADLEAAGDNLRATVSDLTHGYGMLALSGPRAAELLPRLCGLDTSEAGFPDGRVAQTSLAKVHATLVRADEGAGSPRYYLLVDRSLSAYVWDVIEAVMQAINIER